MKLIIFLLLAGVLYLLMRNKIAKRGKRIDTADMAQDKICGTYVDMATPYRLKYCDKVYYFCSEKCADKFRLEYGEKHEDAK